MIRISLSICLILLFNLSFAQTDSIKMEKIKKIKLSEFKDLTQDIAKSKKYSDEYNDVFILENNSLILKSKVDRTIIFYYNKQHYFELVDEASRLNGSSEHILLEYQYDLSNYNFNDSSYKDIKSRLSKSFNLSLEDIGEKELLNLSSKINKIGGRKVLDSLYIPLVILIGEKIKSEVNGQWVFQYDDLSGVKEPYIEANQRVYNPWKSLYKALYEEEKINLAGIIAVEIEGSLNN